MTDDKNSQDKELKTEVISDTKQKSIIQPDTNASADTKTVQQQSKSDLQIETGPSHRQIDQSSNPPEKSKRPKLIKKADIASCEDFITYAYNLKGRKVSLKGKIQKQVAEAPTLSEEAKQRLYETAQKDKTLMVPRQLLLAAMDVAESNKLRIVIISFIRNILLKHPLFLHSDIEAAVRNHEDAPDPIKVLKKLANSDKSVVETLTGMKMKDMEFNKLRCNAVNCMAVWLTEKKGLSIPVISDALCMALWTQKKQLLKTDSARLRALTEISNFAGVGLACGEYLEQAKEEKQAADEAIGKVNSLTEKVNELEDKIDSSLEEIERIEEERKTEKKSFDNAISKLKKQSEAEVAHLRDDLEKLRTSVLRQLKSDAGLLEDGLQALRRSEPKVHIMLDIAERVTDALRQQITNLEGEN